MGEQKGNILMHKYEMGKMLGQGTFAKVYHARNIETSQSVAIKVTDKEKVLKGGLTDQIKREISVMKLVKHPNIVQMYEVMATKTKIYFVLEHVKGGELFNKVQRGRLKEDAARKYFQQLICAVDFCHSRGVYHRDLKPENLLLDENSNLKVSDFGLSTISECRRLDGLLHTSCGTPAYVAPEVINRKGYDGAKADIWSCGVILFVLMAGSKELLACKSISKRKLRTPVDVEDVRREVAIMRHLPRSASIVTLREACEDDGAVHLVMELCEGGELFDRIVARGHYTERAAAAVTRTIVEVVQLCHHHGVIHRDLKPENFLFANKKENSPLKAIDFGLSIFFKPGEKFSEIVGSPYYMAPEVLKRNYGPEIDIWSAGVILYILLCGVPPFWAETEQGVAQAILRGNIDFKREPWPHVSDNAKDLVRQMLQPDPKIRLTAKQVLEHTWLQNAKKAPNVPLGDIVKSRLKQFSRMNRFKRRALRVIADHLSAEEVEDIKEMFKVMDTDNDGIVSYEELKSGIAKFGSHLAESEVQMLIEAVDTNGRGALDYGEFLAVSLHLQRMANDEHLRRAFLFFDKDGDGFIEPEELQEALAEDGAVDITEVVKDILQEVDTDKDGKISFEEFVAMMKTGTDWRKASRHYSRGRFNSLSIRLIKDGSVKMGNE